MAPAATRLGSQEPTFSTVGDCSRSDGGYAADMFRGYGARFYGSQELELRAFLARDGDGGYAARTICVSKPRQNGKSFAARFYAIWMAAIEGRRVLFSAHHGKTVRKMFKEIKGFVESTPDFAAMLVPNGGGFYNAAGSEGVYFADERGRPAGMIEFQTRTASAARGETYQVIIVDEAQELTDEQLEAIKPTTLAASEAGGEDGGPQMVYLGTPPGPKCPGTVFRDLHDRAHEGRLASAWWMEWAAARVPDMADRAAVMELVYLTNPAMGRRISEETMLDAMDTMRPDGFARECLGWWDGGAAAERPIPKADWAACREPLPPSDGLLAYAAKFSADGSRCSIAVCLRPEEGDPHVEVALSRPTSGGIEWAVEWLAARHGRAAEIAIDGKSCAQELRERLLAAKVPERMLCTPSSGDVAAACSSFANAVRERRVTHFGQPALDAAATLSPKRRIGSGGGWGFESTEAADATLVEACALAHWRAVNTKRKPGRKLRIG